MSLFGGPAKQSYLGIDLGAAGIKVVELVNERGRARLVTYGWSERLTESAGQNQLDQIEDTARLIKKIVERAACASKKVVSGIPISQIFSSIIAVDVPATKKKELDAAVKLQARKIAPRPLEEMVIDYKIIEQTPQRTKVLLTAAEVSLVRKYVEVFKKTGLELLSLETEALALIRSLVGRDPAITILVDLGALRTNISVIEKGVPLVSRSIDVGGISFTRAIAEQLKLGTAAAEQTKLDLNSSSALMPAAGWPAALRSPLEVITSELRYVLNIYAQQTVGAVEKIVLTGGAALLPRLSETIGAALGVKTFLGDPWARIIYPDDLRPILDQIGPRFAVAVGLAMRDIE